jgi:acetyl esterase
VLAVVRDTSVPVDGGAIDVRIYEGEGKAPRPAFVYFHGGAWWLGDLEQGDALCRTIAAELGCSVVSVAYRLAPEHKFPVPFEDCFAATQWVARNAAELGVDAGRLAVGGGSAGGNLAAAVALAARDRSGPNLCFQLLDIPVTDVSMQAPSHTENAEGYLLTRAGMEQGWDHYLARPEDGRSPYASPLLAEDLRDLPPALVLTAEFDPLRDEGEDYARRLAGAGVPVTLRRFEGMIHGFAAMTKLLPQARECRAMVVQALRGAFEG